MESWNDDDDKNPINTKLILFLFGGFFIFLFVAGLFIMVPWLSSQQSNWQAILIDNAIILIIGGVFFFGVIMATRMR
ncbi:MAG: hypothetical protein KC553_03945 [Nitrospina sp.]|nr:hypothetical protein [Nitrospina sp.]